ncbi:unnamed protein product [Prunus armeniaca]
MSSPNTCAKGSSSSVPPDFITGTGVDKHAIEVRSKLHPFAKKNLDKNVLHLFENTLVLGPHWFGYVPTEMANLFKDDAEAPMPWLLILGGLVSMTPFFCPSSLSIESKIFWVLPSASGILPTTLGDYHRKKNQEKLAKPFIISPATINQNCSFSNYLRKFSAEKDKDQQYVLFLFSSPTIQTSAHCHHGESPEPVCSNYSLANLAEGLLPRTEALHLEVCCSMAGGAQKDLSLLRSAQKDFVLSTLDPSLTKNIGGQSIQAGEVIDLELPSGDEEDETLAEQLPVQATLSGRRNKKKETAPIHENSVQLEVSLKVLLPLLLSQKGVERGLWWSMWPQKNLQQLPPTSGTDEELREAFEAMEQERELVGEEGPQEKTKKMKEEEIPAEVIAESIALAQKQQETPRAKLTSSELVLFEDAEEEHSTAVLAELLVAAPESEIEVAAAVLGLVVEVPRTARVLVVMTSPFKPPIVAMPIHSFLEFEAMDLEPSWTGWRNSVPLLARPSQRQWMRQWRG